MDDKTKAVIAGWRDYRQKARTDLIFLCKTVLHYEAIEETPHRQLTDALQKFSGGTDLYDEKKGAWNYNPYCPYMWNLTGPRFRIFLWPRGHFKTTIITMAHTIQWLINYPDVRILISTAIGEQAERMLSEIKAHFQFNQHFRFLFPEFSPEAAHVKDFGNASEFTVPNRVRKWLKEPSVSVSSLGKVISSYHYEILKFSDMVDKENVKTPNQIRDVIEHINYCDPLLERSTVPPHHGWKDIEGTRYALGDAYGDIIRKERERREKLWRHVEQSAEVDINRKVSLFPARFPWSELKRIEADDPIQYSSQYLQRPVPESSALATEKELIFFPRIALREISLRLHTTVDLHGMEANTGNDYTVLTTCGFDRDGRVYVLEIRRGHFTPFDTINHLFDIWKSFKGNSLAGVQDIKIEKDAHARVLGPFFQRECAKRQIYPNVIFIPRSNKTSKRDRIRGLQAWFKAGVLRFADDLPSKSAIITEILNFGDPSTHDDILDTLADQMQNRDKDLVEGDIYPRASEPMQFPAPPPWAMNKFEGFNEFGEPMWRGNQPEQEFVF